MKYICELCGTIYDEAVGNVKQGIPAGTSFEKLPTHYDCPCCGSHKEAYTPMAQHTPIKLTPDSGEYIKYSPARPVSDR